MILSEAVISTTTVFVEAQSLAKYRALYGRGSSNARLPSSTWRQSSPVCTSLRPGHRTRAKREREAMQKHDPPPHTIGAEGCKEVNEKVLGISIIRPGTTLGARSKRRMARCSEKFPMESKGSGTYLERGGRICVARSRDALWARAAVSGQKRA